MHRTRRQGKSLPPQPIEAALNVDSAVFSSPSPDAVHALFAPLHYERGYEYPLVVWLHPQGSDERHLLRVMPLVSMRNYVAVAPRGLCLDDASAGEIVYGWRQTESHIQQAEQRVFDTMEIAARQLHVGRRRIFLAGFDSGGTMAFRLGMNRPDRFAGVLSLCGSFPSGGTPLANLVAARQLPIFLAVGRHSSVYPPAEVCENLRLLHSAGMSVTLREYPCGHELSPQMLSDVDRWIIEQITAAGRWADNPANGRANPSDRFYA